LHPRHLRSDVLLYHLDVGISFVSTATATSLPCDGSRVGGVPILRIHSNSISLSNETCCWNCGAPPTRSAPLPTIPPELSVLRTIHAPYIDEFISTGRSNLHSLRSRLEYIEISVARLKYEHRYLEQTLHLHERALSPIRRIPSEIISYKYTPSPAVTGICRLIYPNLPVKQTDYTKIIAGPLGSATYGKGHLSFVPFFATCTNRFSQATLVITK
jgi:hypothetical protein